MQTPPFGVTIVHDTVVFFMSIHMNDCSCVHSCVTRGLSTVRTYNIYISTYRTSLSVYNIFHMINTLTASHVASMIDTTDNTMCCHDGRCRSYDHMIQSMCINHMIFYGDNTHKIHYIEVYGVSTPSHVCLYTLPILNAI